MGRIRRIVSVLATSALLHRNGAEHGRHPRTDGRLPVIVAGGRLRIGDDAWFRGLEARASLVVERGGELVIGSRALINSGASIHCAEWISVGDDLRMAAFASIADSDQHEVVPGGGVRCRRVVIGDDVWIGRGAIVLPGVNIGDGAVVGAGAVVVHDVEPYTVVVGNPARPVRSYQPTGATRS